MYLYAVIGLYLLTYCNVNCVSVLVCTCFPQCLLGRMLCVKASKHDILLLFHGNRTYFLGLNHYLIMMSYQNSLLGIH